MRKFNNFCSIPVLYLHSAGNHPYTRPWSFLSVPIEVIEGQFKWFTQEGYRTIFLKDLYLYKKGVKGLPPKSVVLTFDDGFLDNWVYVWPLAEKYGIKFTIFVNLEFMDPIEITRPTLKDVWNGSLQSSELDWWGYLSWDEMREMESSGLVDIQSHALTHMWHFKGSEIIDFHYPGDRYYWLILNKTPSLKPYWLTEYKEDLVPYGYPIYSFGKSLEVRRYFEDPNLSEILIEYVEKNGGVDFFDFKDWRRRLYKIVNIYKEKNSLKDRYESEEEYRNRICNELFKSKIIIEEKLDKKVEFLCWPGGGVTPQARRIAKEIGYLSTTKGTTPNLFNSDFSSIYRIAGWFEQPMPDALKWYLFKGQLDRGRAKFTPSSLFIRLMAWMYHLYVSKKH